MSALPVSTGSDRLRAALRGLPLLSLVLGVTSASADLYKWSDERGNLVISNQRPADMGKVRNFELALKEQPLEERPQGAARGAPTRNEQALLERIDKLERELRAQQSPQRERPAPPLSYSGAYDYAPPPPPPSAGYYSSYYPGYYYPTRPYSYVVYPRSTFVARPSIAFSHRVPSRGGFAQRARR